MGGFFYNRGLYDAETAINEKVAEISDLLLRLEKPVTSGRQGKARQLIMSANPGWLSMEAS